MSFQPFNLSILHECTPNVCSSCCPRTRDDGQPWHPSRGWGHESEQQAHRTLANRAGFAVGHSGQKTVGAALAAVQDLTTAAQASWFGRTGRNDLANAVMRNGIGPHIFDFDDTHFGDKA